MPEGLEHFGFMNEMTELYAGKGGEQTYTFLHLSLQEYLAAWHLGNSYSAECQIAYHKFALDEGMKGYNEVMDQGIERESEKEDHEESKETKAFISQLNPLSSSVVEPAIFLAGITGWRGPLGNNCWESYLSTAKADISQSIVLLRSLYESQNPEICQYYFTIIKGKFPLWTVGIGAYNQTPYDCYALSYCLNYCHEDINLSIVANEDNSLAEIFVRGLHDHCHTKTLKVRCLHLNVEGNSLSFDWLTSARNLTFTELEIFAISSVHMILQVESYFPWEWVKSLKRFHHLIITCSHTPPELKTICWLLENCLTILDLKVELTPSVYDIGPLSSTATYISSVLKSVLVQKQITCLTLPSVSRENMKYVHRIILECDNLVELEMYNARLGYDGILFICRALRNNTTLAHLTISEYTQYPSITHFHYPFSMVDIQTVETITLPTVTTCTSFLLEMNDILRNNTTLNELNIESDLIFSAVGPLEEDNMWRKFTGLGPLQQFNSGSIESLTPHTLKKSYSLSDISQLLTDVVWYGDYLENITSTDTSII